MTSKVEVCPGPGICTDPGCPAFYAPIRQYYYRDPSCVAEDSEGPWCTCWHDQGTGPQPNLDAEKGCWRDKPAPRWRDHSKQFAKGEQCPATLETLQAAWDRDQEVMFALKGEVSRLRETVNQLRQKLASRSREPLLPEAWVIPLPLWSDSRQPYGRPLNHGEIEAAKGFNLALAERTRLNRRET